MSNLQHVENFIEAVGLNPQDLIQFRQFPPKHAPEKYPGYAKNIPGNVATVISQLVEANKYCGIYFSPNNMVNDTSVWSGGNVIFYEIDDKTLDEQYRIAYDLESKLGAKATLVQTDKSLHVYFRLRQQINKQKWHALQSRLIQTTHSDKSIRNLSRVMRVPGFDHLRFDENKNIVRTPVILKQVSNDTVDNDVLETVLEPISDAFWNPKLFTKLQKRYNINFHEDVLPLLNFVHEFNDESYRCQCPHHTKGDDPNNHSDTSLSILKDGGWHCFNGCDPTDVFYSAIELAKTRGYVPPNPELLKVDDVLRKLRKILSNSKLDIIERNLEMEPLKSGFSDFIWRSLVAKVEATLSPINLKKQAELLDEAFNFVPAFDCFEGKFNDYIQIESLNLGQRPEHLSMSLIMSLAPLFNKYSLRVSGNRVEPLIFYSALIGVTGSGKTPIMSHFQRHLSEYQNHQNKDYYELAKMGHKPEQNEPPIFHKDYVVTDTTIPALIQILSNQSGNSVLLPFDEGSEFFNLISTRNGHNANYLPFCLTNFNGGDGNKRLKTESPNSSFKYGANIYFGIQPELISQRYQKATDDVGLNARVLPTLIKDSDTTPLPYLTPPAIDFQRYFDYIDSLSGGELVLSPEAQELLFEAERRLDKRQKTEANTLVRDFLPKARTYLYRLSAIIYLINQTSSQSPIKTVDKRSAIAATHLIGLFVNNMVLIASLAQGKYTDLYIKALFKGSLNLADIYQTLSKYGNVTLTDCYDHINYMSDNSMGYAEGEEENFMFYPNRYASSQHSNIFHRRILALVHQEGFLSNSDVIKLLGDRPYSELVDFLLSSGVYKIETGFTTTPPEPPSNDDNGGNDDNPPPAPPSPEPLIEEEIIEQLENEYLEPIEESVIEQNAEPKTDSETIHPEVTTEKPKAKKLKFSEIETVETYAPIFSRKSNRIKKNNLLSPEQLEQIAESQEIATSQFVHPWFDKNRYCQRVDLTWLRSKSGLNLTTQRLNELGFDGDVFDTRKVNEGTKRIMTYQIYDVLTKCYETFPESHFYLYMKDGVPMLKNDLINAKRLTFDMVRRGFGLSKDYLEDVKTRYKRKIISPEFFQTIIKEALIDEDGKITHEYRHLFEAYGDGTFGLKYKAYTKLERKSKNTDETVTEVIDLRDVSGESEDKKRMTVDPDAIYTNHEDYDLFDTSIYEAHKEEMEEKKALIRSILPTLQDWDTINKVVVDIETYALEDDERKPAFDEEFQQLWVERGFPLDEQPITAIGLNVNGEISMRVMSTEGCGDMSTPEFLDHLLKEEEKLLEWFYGFIGEVHKSDRNNFLIAHNGANFDFIEFYKRTRFHSANNKSLKREGRRWITQLKKKSCSSSDFYGRPYSYYEIELQGWNLIDTLCVLACQNKIGAINYKTLGLKKAAEIEGVTAKAVEAGIIPEGESRVILPVADIIDAVRNPSPQKLASFEKYLKLDVYECMGLFDNHFKGFYYQKRLSPLTFQELLYKSPAYKVTETLKFIYRELHNGFVGDKTLYELKRIARNITKYSYEGGKGFAKPGIYSNLVSEDLGSQYPSIIINYFLVPRNDIEKYFIAFIDLCVDVSNSLKQQAKVAKCEGNDQLAILLLIMRLAAKVKVNGGASTPGTEGFEFQDNDVVACMTAIGRKMITVMADKLKEIGLTRIELATDGIKYDYSEDCGLTVEEIHQELKKVLPDFMALDTEVVGGVILLRASKNYIYWKSRQDCYDNKPPELKGYFGKTIIEPFLRDFSIQSARYYIFPELKGFSDGKEAVHFYYEEVKASLLNRTIDPRALILTTKIGVTDKTKQKETGKEIGSYIDYYYTQEGKHAKITLEENLPTQPYWIDYYVKALEGEYKELLKLI